MSILQPLVSVLLPSYNVAKYIRQCIESVCNQTLDCIEIICIDGGSTDGTLEILNEFAQKDSRIRLFHSEKKSYGFQMNIGLQAANGIYIGIIETDDYVSSNMVENLYNLSDDGKIDIIKGNYWELFDSDTSKIIEKKSLRNNIKDNAVFTLKEKPEIMASHPSIWSAIYRKKFLDENKIHFLEEPGAGWVDNPFYFETLCAAKSIRWTSKPFYYYRMTNPNSSTNNLTDPELPIRRMMNNLDILEKNHITEGEVLSRAYEYAIYYARLTIQRDDYSELQVFLRPALRQMMKRLDKQVIFRYMNFDAQLTYFEAISPLPVSISDRIKYDFSAEDIIIMNEEYEFLKNNLMIRAAAEDGLNATKNSWSWKIGNMLMQLPSRIKRMIK